MAISLKRWTDGRRGAKGEIRNRGRVWLILHFGQSQVGKGAAGPGWVRPSILSRKLAL